MSVVYEGRCQCGDVSYRISDMPITSHACHCIECQKRSGSAFGISLVIDKDAFLLTGKLQAFTRVAESGFKLTQHFCTTCGNTIYTENERRVNAIVLHPGTLEDTDWIELNRMIWTNRAQKWFEFPSDLELFEESQPF